MGVSSGCVAVGVTLQSTASTVRALHTLAVHALRAVSPQMLPRPHGILSTDCQAWSGRGKRRTDRRRCRAWVVLSVSPVRCLCPVVPAYAFGAKTRGGVETKGERGKASVDREQSCPTTCPSCQEPSAMKIRAQVLSVLSIWINSRLGDLDSVPDCVGRLCGSLAVPGIVCDQRRL